MPTRASSPEPVVTRSRARHVIGVLAPWYGGAATLYAAARRLYDWLHGSGVVAVPFRDELFLICQVVGASILLSVVIGAVAGALVWLAANAVSASGQPTDDRAFWWPFTVVSPIGFVLILALIAMDAQRSLNQVKYDAGSWFFALLGAAISLATYVLFVRKLLDDFRRP